jgi:molecular chaperone DnaK
VNSGAVRQTAVRQLARTEQGERLGRQLARRQAILNPKGTITAAKRFIGRRYGEVSSDAKAVSFDRLPAAGIPPPSGR